MLALQETQIHELQNSILKFNEIFGGEIVNTIKYLSTGNETLDLILQGGYKKGTLTEITGVSDSGKTLLALKAIKEVQKNNKIAIYIDADCKVTSNMLKDNSIEEENVVIIHMSTADMIGPMLSELIKPYVDDIGIIIIDNLASLTTSKEQRSPLNVNTDIHRSKVIKGLLTRLSNIIRNTEACGLVINQERSNIIDNQIQGTVSSSERWVNMTCDTRIRLALDEDNEVYVEANFKDKKIK